MQADSCHVALIIGMPTSCLATSAAAATGPKTSRTPTSGAPALRAPAQGGTPRWAVTVLAAVWAAPRCAARSRNRSRRSHMPRQGRDPAHPARFRASHVFAVADPGCASTASCTCKSGDRDLPAGVDANGELLPESQREPSSRAATPNSQIKDSSLPARNREFSLAGSSELHSCKTGELMRHAGVTHVNAVIAVLFVANRF